MAVVVRWIALLALAGCQRFNPAFCLDGVDGDECVIPPDGPPPTQCNNGSDDDLDGLSDLEDPGCFGGEDDDEHSLLACDDGMDSDGDGLIDLADPGCSGPADPDEHANALICDDGLDNEPDGRADFRADGSGDVCCASPTTPAENCPCISRITAGTAHTCALKVNASNTQIPSCWGDNMAGSVGDNSMMDRTVPTPVSQLPAAVEIVAGGGHTCARLADKTVRCWGLGDKGQLGNNAIDNSPLPVTVGSLANVVQLAAGTKHTCARLDDGTVWCWGDNGHDQLGNTGGNSRVPVQVAGLAQVVDVAAGSSHTCATRNDGSVQCWGENDKGQLGRAENSTAPMPVVGLAAATQLALGTKFSCALLEDHTVSCWGDNVSGQLGDNKLVNERSTPAVIAGLSGATQISAGGQHACARLSTGALACWGENAHGQIGDNATADRLVPFTVPITLVISVSAGGEHTCVTRDDTQDVVQCWGINSNGQLGNNSLVESRSPTSANLTCP